MYSLFVHAEAPDARILAFEPVPALFDRLRENLVGVPARLFAHGLSDTEREVSFTYYPGYTTMSTRSDYADTPADKEFVKQRVMSDGAGELLEHLDEILDWRFEPVTEVCRLRRLSDVIVEERLDRVDMLKIDVQRAELDVLRGIEERHWPLVRQVAMEVHDTPGTLTSGRLRTITDLLHRHGFTVTCGEPGPADHADRFALAASRP
jgi:FkbM family methyltransferase